MSLVVDIHTHMLNGEWLQLLKRHGGPRYTVAQVEPGDALAREGLSRPHAAGEGVAIDHASSTRARRESGSSATSSWRNA